MFVQTISCILIFAVAVFLAVPLGKYLSRIYKEEKSLLGFLLPLENRNGSEFSGLGNNTVFWNLTTSVVMLCGRFLPTSFY